MAEYRAEQNTATAEKKPSKQTIEMTIEQGSFKKDNGKQVDYVTCFVEILGVKVKMQPKDDTGKQLLATYLKKGVN